MDGVSTLCFVGFGVAESQLGVGGGGTIFVDFYREHTGLLNFTNTGLKF